MAIRLFYARPSGLSPGFLPNGGTDRRKEAKQKVLPDMVRSIRNHTEVRPMRYLMPLLILAACATTALYFLEPARTFQCLSNEASKQVRTH